MENEYKELTSKELTYKTKKNKSYEMATKILESICERNLIDEKIKIDLFKEKDFYNWYEYSQDIDEILDESKNIIKEATRIIRIFELLVHNRPYYTLSTKEWFDSSRYSVDDKNVLKELSEILLYYVGNCPNAEVHNFFNKLDFLIEYVIKPALEHNESFEKEKYIINSINKEIEILDDNNQPIFVTVIQIKLKSVSISKIEKVLVYTTDVNNIIKEVSIDKVILKNKQNSSDSQFTNPTMLKTYTSFESYETEIKANKNIEVILEINTLMYEYFKIKPIKNMKVYATQEELKEFQQTIEYKPKNNKFYIVASDTEEMILSTVLHCLPYAVIINNNNLNDKLIKRFKDYAKEADFEICPPSPNTPNEPNSNSNEVPKNEGEKSTTKKPKKKRSKEQIEKNNQLIKDINESDSKLLKKD